MKWLFSKSSLKILESLSFTQTLYAFDFDGTLSKIVRHPHQAKMTKTTADLLLQLSRQVPVAIVSGRSLDDLKQRVEFQPKYLIGNHGIEGVNYRWNSLLEAKNQCELWKTKLEQFSFDSGVQIENKMYSLSIHYRRSRHKKLSREQIKNAIANLNPMPQVIPGKCVFNLLPIGAPHKGASLLELIKQDEAKHAFYIGDDDTDEDVFGLHEVQMMTVRVGEKKTSHAQFYIRRQSEINRLLKLLIHYRQTFHPGRRK